jgi:uncharacterized membrane protein
MSGENQQTGLCQVCRQEKNISELRPGDLVRPPVVEIIKRAQPDWDAGGYICMDDLNRFRAAYLQKTIETDKGELTSLEETVVKSLKEQELLACNVNISFGQQLTFGERVADRVTDFGGSWHFIILFLGVIFLWIVVNSVLLIIRPFDPYPYIFLNLVLSCMSAIQAPIILMSQNRQEARDRIRDEHNYRINLKAELEIRQLHEKLDHLLSKQLQRHTDTQKVLLDVMAELSNFQRYK